MRRWWKKVKHSLMLKIKRKLGIYELMSNEREQDKMLGELEQRIVELEEFMRTAKGVVAQKNSNYEKRNKWLNGYPDETKK